jgi:integrase
MGVRKKNGKWHYQFQHQGHTYFGNTGLDDTDRHKNAAIVYEAKQRELVVCGQSHLLRLEVTPFSAAADQFIEWAKGEYREHPNSWKRLRGSMKSLKVHFAKRPISSITSGHIEDFKSWRRADGTGVAEVTIRHDLHALSLLLRYSKKHNWIGSVNPLDGVEIPSDEAAVRMHVLSDAEEKLYFEAAARQSQDLHDLGRLMILQGPRPWCEVARTRVEHIDLVKGEWWIPKSKSRASARTLYLRPESISIMARRISTLRADGWLFHGKTLAGHMQDLQKSHEAVLEKLGERTFAMVIYDFRHTFATRAAQGGMDISTLARVLGHRDLRTVQKYVHVDENHVKHAMEKAFNPHGVFKERNQEQDVNSGLVHRPDSSL